MAAPLRLGLTAALLLIMGPCGGCLATQTRSTPASGYVEGASYETRTELPADVFRDGRSARVQTVQFLTNGDIDPMGGRIETIPSGTTIRVSRVLVRDTSDMGKVVRVLATVTSGPYAGAVANLYGISLATREAGGGTGPLTWDPRFLTPAP